VEIVGDGNIDGGRKKKHGEQLSPKAMITPVVQSCHPYSHDKQLAASDQSRLRHWCIGMHSTVLSCSVWDNGKHGIPTDLEFSLMKISQRHISVIGNRIDM